jgi:hypothetical protein
VTFFARRALLAWAGGTAAIAVIPETRAAQGASDHRAGSADFVSGDVRLSDAAGSKSMAVGTSVYAGQTIETGADSEAHVKLDDGGYLAVRPGSRIRIDAARITGSFDDSLTMSLLRGAIRSVTGWVGKFDKHSYQLNAGTATVGIRGTDHELALIEAAGPGDGPAAGIHNWVNEGGTTLKTAGGSLDIEPGQAAWAEPDGRMLHRHQGLPAFLRRFQTRQEGRASKHAENIRSIIEERMRQRGLLQPGERLEDAQQRHQRLRELREAHPEAGNGNGNGKRGEWLEERRKKRLEWLEEEKRRRREKHPEQP